MEDKYYKSCDKTISYSNWAHHLKSKKHQEQLKINDISESTNNLMQELKTIDELKKEL